MKFFQDEVSETHYAIFDGASDAARGVVETVDLESTEVAGSVDMETSGDFIGRRFLNWRDAVNEARDKSWDDGVKELNRMCKELETIEFPELKGRGRKREANDDGDGDINFEKFFAGESKIFETNKSEEDAGTVPTITLYCDASAPWTVGSLDILWRGAAAIALTQLLESKGYRVELWVVTGAFLFNENNEKTIVAVNLKKPEDPLDTVSLINIVAGWFFRTFTFKRYEMITESLGYTMRPSLGQASTPTMKELHQITSDPHKIYVSDVFKLSAAREVIEAELQRYAKEE